MAGFNTVFKRVEVKYFIPKEKIDAFKRAVDPYMQLDDYGLTTIMNIYYDNEENDLLVRSLAKPKYKEKLRLRTYGIPGKDSTAFIELKKKADGIVYKRRAAMKLSEAERFLNEGIAPEEKTQIIREIEYFLSFYRPVPKTMIAYDREAYFGREDPNFRMTLDRRIRYREDDLVLSDGDRGTLLDKNGGYLLEIKVNGAMPLFMSRILTGLRIYPVSFSKVGKAYEIIHGGETHKLMNVYGYERNNSTEIGGYALCS